MADSRWRYTKFISRQFEAQMPSGSLEGTKSDQWRQAQHIHILDEMNSSALKFFEFALGKVELFDYSPKPI